MGAPACAGSPPDSWGAFGTGTPSGPCDETDRLWSAPPRATTTAPRSSTSAAATAASAARRRFPRIIGAGFGRHALSRLRFVVGSRFSGLGPGRSRWRGGPRRIEELADAVEWLAGRTRREPAQLVVEAVAR